VTFCTLTKVKYKIEHKVHRTKANVSPTCAKEGITHGEHLPRYIYPGKSSRGRKPSKNFLIINSLYNVQEITQTNTEKSSSRDVPPFFSSLQLINVACLIRE
jgi:hypothetical protein